MNTRDILNDKLGIITWVSQLEDASLIKRLKEIQVGHVDIPQYHQDTVAERLDLIEKGIQDSPLKTQIRYENISVFFLKKFS